MTESADISAQPLALQILDSSDTALLRALGFRDPDRALRSLESLVAIDGSATLPANFFRDLTESPDSDVALINFDRLSSAVVSRAAFFRLLDSRPGVGRTLLTLLGSSQYLSDIVVRDPANFYWLIESPDRLSTLCERSYYDREIDAALRPFGDLEPQKDALRRLARRELLRIGAADLIGARPIHRVADELSDLADAVLDRVIAMCVGELAERYGLPENDDGTPATFAVIGLGKLGGQELNFSSDIDLMFVYSGEGKTVRREPGSRSVPNQEYFTRLSERMIQALIDPTVEGFLYRVDMRLRPDGAVGALTMPIGAYEAYYARRGDLWERQMLIKARVAAGSHELGDRFLRMIRPFVFPGHIDGSPVEEIHRIKQRIEGKIGKKGEAETHLKLRSGGIRDIEFVVQCLQLIVGQVHEHARSGHTLEAIQQLRRVGALSDTQASALSDAYLFFRRLEHRLQMMHGLSDYTLPETEENQLPMARSMGLDSTESYRNDLEGHLTAVQTIYSEVFSEGDDPGASRSVASLCEIELGDPEALQILSDIGFTRPGDAHRNLVYLAFGHAPRIRGTQARRSFMELAPALIAALTETVNPDQALSHLERLVSAYGAGNTLFQTLNAKPGLRNLILKLCAGSEFLIGILVRNPGLLDWLILPDVLLRERDEVELEAELDRVVEGDWENDQQIAALNDLRNRERLRIGTRDLLGLSDSFSTFEALTLLAESILRRVYVAGYERLVEKWGWPRTERGEVCPFVILGLGKMGGRELNFGSDLDLVFVYGEDGRTDKGQGNLQFFVELCQSIVNDFGKLTRNGSLYEIDARLRPEGGNALLALSYDTYSTYLKNRAKSWERLALSRARMVAGNVGLGKRMLERFEQFVVGDGLNSRDLEEILDVRGRMEKKSRDTLSIKTPPGGIVDVEFLVQVLQIRHARSHQGLRTPATREGLRLLGEAGLLDLDSATELDDNFVFLRTVEKVLRRQDEKGKTRLPKEGLALQAIAKAVSSEDGATLMTDLKARMKVNRELFNRYMGKGS